MTTDSSADVYRMLAATRSSTGITTRDTRVLFSGVPVQQAVDRDGAPMLIVPIVRGTVDVSEMDDLALQVLVVDEPVRLLVRCKDPRLVPQFSYLVDDMLDFLMSATAAAAGSTCLAVLHNWRELFRAAPSPLLSVEAQIGLLAELRVLEAILEIDPSALNCWAGPSGGRHDFSGPRASLEVKSTARHNQFDITIHGLGQLDTPSGGVLYLYAERVERSESDRSESLVSIVERLKLLTRDIALLSRMLMSAGIDMRYLPAYGSFTFDTLEQRLLVVDERFPRVSASAIGEKFAALIPSIQYSVNVGGVDALAIGTRALSDAANLVVEHNA